MFCHSGDTADHVVLEMLENNIVDSAYRHSTGHSYRVTIEQEKKKKDIQIFIRFYSIALSGCDVCRLFLEGVVVVILPFPVELISTETNPYKTTNQNYHTEERSHPEARFARWLLCSGCCRFLR